MVESGERCCREMLGTSVVEKRGVGAGVVEQRWRKVSERAL